MELLLHARVCLDMLRARSGRREEPLDAVPQQRRIAATDSVDPEQEAVLADSIGVALTVIPQALAPAERLAFALHDMSACRSPTSLRSWADRRTPPPSWPHSIWLC
jgi:hypothetical protein